MKRTIMLVSGILLVAAFALTIACGSDDKKDANSSTPEAATKTAQAAGGTPGQDGRTASPVETRNPTSVSATVQADRTAEEDRDATEDARDATDDAEDATRDASRDATREAEDASRPTETPEPEDAG